jgi:hypothetical protein
MRWEWEGGAVPLETAPTPSELEARAEEREECRQRAVPPAPDDGDASTDCTPAS